MLLINCISGLPVRIISKSVGGKFDYLGYEETKIEEISEEDGEIIVVDRIGNYFLPSDLMPLWEEGE